MNNSIDYKRAQAMVLSDKYNMSRTDFFKQLAELASKHFEYDGMTVDMYSGDNLNVVVTISVKKVKQSYKPTV